jgi:hypothetical protein
MSSVEDDINQQILLGFILMTSYLSTTYEKTGLKNKNVQKLKKSVLRSVLI